MIYTCTDKHNPPPHFLSYICDHYSEFTSDRKDIIIHGPGDPCSLVVRAMYYTPLPKHADDIIIKVEVSCSVNTLLKL